MVLRLRHALIWRLAGPLILTNVSIALLGMVDTAVVGHLENAYYLGAVAVAAVIFNFLYVGMNFLRMGTTGTVAQIHGRNDAGELRSSLLHAVALALVLGGLILILQQPVVRFGLAMLGGSEPVRVYARVYFDWAIWGAPAVLVTLAVTGWLLGVQNARATLVTALATNVVNVILDFVFVFGLDMGVRGVALASVIGQYMGMLTGGWLVARELRRYPGRWQRESLLDRKRFLSLLSLNWNIMLRTFCIITTFAFFTRQGAQLGNLVLAANAILIQFLMFISMGLDGFANAVEALVGRAIGARDRVLFRQAVYTATAWSVIVALVFSLFYLLGGTRLIGVMTDLQDVRDVAHDYLPWIILAPLVGVWCYLLDGLFIGATRGRQMRDTMILSTFLVFFPAWYVLQPLGNHGLWLALVLFLLARGLGLGCLAVHIERRGGGFLAPRAVP